MGQEITLTASDGGRFAAYLALPARLPAPGLIVLPEVFNTNPHIRSVADGYAADGLHRTFARRLLAAGGRELSALHRRRPRQGAGAVGASSTPTSSPATSAT